MEKDYHPERMNLRGKQVFLTLSCLTFGIHRSMLFRTSYDKYELDQKD